MTATAFDRGHRITWDASTGVWRFDDGALAPGSGGVERSCIRCGLTAAPGGPDPCLGMIEGVTAACCGHGVARGYVITDKTENDGS